MATIGPKLQIDNFAEYKKNIDSLITQGKTLDSAMKLLESTWDKNTTAQDKAAGKAKILAQEIEAQKAKVAQIAEVVAKATEKYGADSEEVAKWTQAQNKAQTELNRMQHELNDCNDELNDQQRELQQSEKELKSLDKSTDEVTDSMEDAEKQTRSWGDVMKGSLAADAVKNGLKSLANLAKDMASALWDATKAGMGYADEILALSTTTGIATDTLQEFSYMEGIADVETSTIAKSVQKLKKSMSEAESQNKKYNDKMAEAAKITDKQKRAAKEASIELGSTAASFKKLGVSLTDNNGKMRKSEDVFFDIIDALSKIDDETERDTTAMALLGKGATDLNPLIEAGAEQLNAMRQEAHDVGYVMDSETLGALGRTQDAMDRLEKRTEGVKNQFAKGLAPGAEKLATTLDETLGSPRTQRAITVLSEAVGGFLTMLADAAATIIPAVVSAFGIFDDRLATYSDAQLERKAELDGLVETWNNTKQTFKDSADAIWDNKGKVEALFGKLQDLTSETGNVKEADQELANYIINELNEKLGLNIQMIGGVIQGWQDVQTEIKNAISLQTAQSLLTAGEEKYSEALANQEQYLKDAAQWSKELEQAKLDLAAAEENVTTWQKMYDDAVASGDDSTSAYKYSLDQAKSAVSELEGKIESLTEDYNTSTQAAQESYLETENYSKALAAQAEGDYQAVIDYMTQGYNIKRDYVDKETALNAQQLADLEKHRDDQLNLITEYQKHLAAGEAGFNAEQLARYQQQYEALDAELKNANAQQLQDCQQQFAELGATIKNAYYDMTQASERGGQAAAKALGDHFRPVGTKIGGILDDIVKQAGEKGSSIGESTANGIKRGMNSMAAKVARVAGSVMKTVLDTMRSVAAINSPSKVTAGFGMGLGEGLIKGMDKISPMVNKTAEKFMDSTLSAMRPATFSLPDPAAYGGNTYNQQRSIAAGAVTVQVHAAPGQSAESIADAVMDKINRAINSESAVWA